MSTFSFPATKPISSFTMSTGISDKATGVGLPFADYDYDPLYSSNNERYNRDLEGVEENSNNRWRRRLLGCFALLSLWALARELVKGHKINCNKTYPSWIRGNPRSYPIPPDVILGKCIDWESNEGTVSQTSHSVSGTFNDLALDPGLFFISGGSSSYGTFVVSQTSDESELGDKAVATVGVVVNYLEQGFLDIVKVCKVARFDGTTGVGIFTPRWRDRHPRNPRSPPFHIHVKLPKAFVPSFETDLPLFSQNVTGLREGTIFRNLSLKSVNEPIRVEFARGENISVHTVNSPIEGTFRTNSSISLKTDNAPILVDLELHHGNTTERTKADLVTTNDRIIATTNLTTSDRNDGGKFSVSASTVRGRISLDFPEAPVDHALDLDAVTVLDKIDVRLHPAYQGSFQLKTVLDRVKLQVNDSVEDPAGKNRKRVVQTTSVTSNVLDGATWWEEEYRKLGSVLLKTTLGSVVLSL
ncbi:hypothetical protein FA15DRAFT_639645 [Coprinopsis marcescibilis]|uniref:Uncharacterized protein n=1 Tax=Coprinopsis marcescibilis TaxID=230819 RepID=A0A5C3KXK9_COPMA|nr:hypothetical protein FA15DRAFT_639645 [Coprinopsis marcescibilis]